MSGDNLVLGFDSTSKPFFTKYSTAVPIPMLSSFAAFSKFILLPSVIYYLLYIILSYKNMFFYKDLTIFYKMLSPLHSRRQTIRIPPAICGRFREWYLLPNRYAGSNPLR